MGRGSGGAGGSTQRTRNQASSPARRRRGPGGRWSGGRDGRAAGIRAPRRRRDWRRGASDRRAHGASRGARGAAAGRRRRAGAGSPRRRCARRTGAWRRGPRRRRARASQARERGGAAEAADADLSGGQARVGDAAGERGGHARRPPRAVAPASARASAVPPRIDTVTGRDRTCCVIGIAAGGPRARHRAGRRARCDEADVFFVVEKGATTGGRLVARASTRSSALRSPDARLPRRRLARPGVATVTAAAYGARRSTSAAVRAPRGGRGSAARRDELPPAASSRRLPRLMGRSVDCTTARSTCSSASSIAGPRLPSSTRSSPRSASIHARPRAPLASRPRTGRRRRR